MRGRLVTVAAWLVIAVCAIIVAARVHAHYSAPPVAPAVWTPAPLVPASPTASATAAAPVTPSPKRTVTVIVTATATGGGNGQ
jgi:hypothetical protein